MSGIGLHIGLKALLTSQAGLDVTGHNVANANTPGYSRQSLALANSGPLRLRGLWMGTGVESGAISRTVDTILARRIVVQAAGLAGLEARVGSYAQIEALLGEPGGLGLGQRFGAFFESISALSTSPQDPILRGGMLQEAAGFTAQFRDLAQNLERLEQDTLAQVPFDLKEVNRLSGELAGLNVRIVEQEATGAPANDLRDQRQEKLNQLGQLVGITYQEQPNGALTATIGGRMLVGSTQAYALERRSGTGGELELHIQGSSVPLQVLRGEVSARLEMGRKIVPGLRSELDRLARNMILEFNRAHSTSVPAQGYFRQMIGVHPVQDSNKNGSRLDEALSGAGLPFEVSHGELQVNVTDIASGAITVHRIAIDPDATTVGGFIEALTAIEGISAALDTQGHLRIQAQPGKGFDFAARLDPAPDAVGSFGGQRASLATSSGGPFSLADGDTLELLGPAGPISVTLQAASFASIGQASANELADVLNADPGLQANGLRAVTVDGRLVLQTEGIGATAEFSVTGGTALGALGWSPGTSVSGQEVGVEVLIHGAYSGDSNDRFTFTPVDDGVIGTTPGLGVEVRDSSGKLVTILEVGAGYQPGDELEVADGVRVSFGFGGISATNNELFALEVTADSDGADILVALGLNSFFTGTGASDIDVRADLVSDPGRLSVSSTGQVGGNGGLLAMLDLQGAGLAGLAGESLNGFYDGLVSSIAHGAASSQSALETEQFLMNGLLQRRDQISGVNIDEELVNMLQFEQAYQSAARYIQVVSRLSEELLALI